MVIITDWQCWWQVSLQVVGNERKVIIGDDRQAVVAQAGRLGRAGSQQVYCWAGQASDSQWDWDRPGTGTVTSSLQSTLEM